MHSISFGREMNEVMNKGNTGVRLLYMEGGDIIRGGIRDENRETS